MDEIEERGGGIGWGGWVDDDLGGLKMDLDLDLGSSFDIPLTLELTSIVNASFTFPSCYWSLYECNGKLGCDWESIEN